MAWLVLVTLLAFGTGIVLYDSPEQLIGLSDPQLAHMIKAGAMVFTIAGALILSYGERTSIALKQAASWSAIFLGAVSLYTYRGEILDIGLHLADAGSSETAEASTQQDTSQQSSNSYQRVVSITAEDSGHFQVDVLINGTHVSMLADTGATLVTLTDEDARRAGIHPYSLDYNISLRTANGVTMGALVELDEVDVGGIYVRDVQAVISQPGVLHVSLLGMSYFREIGTFELSGDQLILRE